MKLRLALRAAALLSLPLIAPSAFHQLSPALAALPALATDRIAVTVVGKGPDVILIPGLASSAHVWDATAAHLRAGHRVHIVQVAGFAGAPAGANASGPVLQPVVEALHDYIVANRLQGAAVIGHSLGGLMAMKLGIDHPGDAGRILIVDSLPFFGVIMMGPDATVAKIEPIAQTMRARLQTVSQADFAAAEPSQMTRLIKSHTAEADAAVAAASASDPKVVGQAIYEDFTTDLRADLAKIAVPVTMLYPWDASTGAPVAMFDALYQGAFKALPKGTVHRIDGSYHFIMIDQPAAFLAEVDAFLAR